MRKVVIPLAILALIGLDQWVKHWVVANIALNQVIKAIPGLFIKQGFLLCVTGSAPQ